ncbi:MAG: hypothetical protein AB1431_11675 [Pseudomonadota bacterium]
MSKIAHGDARLRSADHLSMDAMAMPLLCSRGDLQPPLTQFIKAIFFVN